MRYEEFGLRLRRIFPKLVEIPLDDAALAQYFLNLYPQYYSHISPAAARIKEISDRTPESQRWTEKGRLESVAQMVAINQAEAESQSFMDVAIRAAGEGLTVEGYVKMRELDHHHHLQKDLLQTQHDQVMELERFRRDNGLEGGERARLTPHYLIRQLEAELMDLIDRRDREEHPDKRDVLNIRIKHLKGELDARGQQTMVQAGGRPGVEFTDKDADRDGSSGIGFTSGVESLSSKKSRMGE